MTDDYTAKYRSVLSTLVGRVGPSAGFPERRVAVAETRLGVRLPAALRDFYTAVGRHPINRAHNRLRPPEELQLAHGRIVFQDENQEVVAWGVRPDARFGPDPGVSQSMDPECAPWIPERVRCSTFLSVILCWQAAGGTLPYAGCSDSIGLRAARRFAAAWPVIGRVGDLTAHAWPGQVILVTADRRKATLGVAARTKRDYQAVVAAVGAPFHET